MSEQFQQVCTTSDVPQGTALAVEIGDEPVAIVHANDDQFYAIRDVCSHEEVELSEGEIEESSVECWLHGSRFDLKTGEPIELPATEPVPVYPVRIDGDNVCVSTEPVNKETVA